MHMLYCVEALSCPGIILPFIYWSLSADAGARFLEIRGRPRRQGAHALLGVTRRSHSETLCEWPIHQALLVPILLWLRVPGERVQCFVVR